MVASLCARPQAASCVGTCSARFGFFGTAPGGFAGRVSSFLRAAIRSSGRVARCVARWGLRAVRVGEASHPGPACVTGDDAEEPEIPEQPFVDDPGATPVAVVDLGATPVAEPIQQDAPSLPGRVPQRAWRELSHVDIEHVFTVRVRTVRDCPVWFRGSLRRAYSIALHHWREHPHSIEAWWVVMLVPRMLLRPTAVQGSEGKRIFTERMNRFMRGDFLGLLLEAEIEAADRPPRAGNRDEFADAVEMIKLAELSRARQRLVSLGLAPGDANTLAELQNTDLRPIDRAPLPPELRDFRPASAIKLDDGKLLAALKSAGRGSAQDLAGTRYEHIRVLIEDDYLWPVFVAFCRAIAAADVPEPVAAAMAMGRMTALKKPNGKVRGIVAGNTIRRLVCRAVARQFGDALQQATAPFQFALQTRAGTDALGHALRSISELDPGAVITSIDGIGAFDHVQRSAMFRQLLEDPALHELVPLVRMFYARTSRFLWTDDDGVTWRIEQGEGGEQGDALMPALYALAQHRALVVAQAQLQPGERVFAFLDDLYVVSKRERAARAYAIIASAVRDHAGVHSHKGKLKMWSSAGGAPPDDVVALATRENPVWMADAPDHLNGLVVLGTPLGRQDFVRAHAEKRMEEEQQLLDKLPRIPDLQCAWLLLSYCAVPRANHLLRVVPPSVVEPYAVAHDEAIWLCFCALVGAWRLAEDALGRQVATLPARLGGLGLRSAARTAPAAFLASWFDALPVIAKKAPDLADDIAADLQSGDPRAPSLRELVDSRDLIVLAGAESIPTWFEAEQGARPPCDHESVDFDAGEWRRGWQYYTSSVFETSFLERVIRPASDDPRRALLLSQSGPASGRWLGAIPTAPETTFKPLRLNVSLRRRLRWPLPIGPRRCNGRACRAVLDDRGDHWASCSTSGKLLRRSRPVERMWARIFREAGARVQWNVFLRDTSLPGIAASDGRRLEVVATGLPLFNGVPLGVDCTVVSPLHADGSVWCQADVRPGVAIERGERAKETTYPDLVDSDRLRLTTLACEIGGRWSQSTVDVVRALAKAKARQAPQRVRVAAQLGWERRWWSMLSVAVQDALASTLVEDGVEVLDGVDGDPPSLCCLLAEACA